MKVTVTETIEHSADITPEMIEAYLRSKGWCLDYASSTGRQWFRSPRDFVVCVEYGEWSPVLVTDAIRVIGLDEDRKPHEVLRDIARGT